MHKRYQHPELRNGEAFWLNVKVKGFFGGRILFSPQFGRERWDTKRLGGIAYDTHGKVLKNYRPVIVQRSELEGKGIDLNKASPK